MGKPQSPTPPSASETAGAQTASNISTALSQQQLNAIDTVGPTGSVKYSQSGTYTFTDPETGKSYALPKLTQTTTLSPEQQAIYDAGVGTQTNLANLARTQSGRLGDLLSSPLDLSNDATEARLNELASKRLDPQLEQQRSALEARLANQGIKLGSTAYDRAMSDLAQQQNDARNQLLLTGHNQAVQEALLQRETPINEILALAGGSQVSVPQGQGTPQTGVAGTDVAGLVTNQYNQNYQNYAQQMQQYNSTLGGLFGLGAGAILKYSDRRLKTDIKKVGKTPGGLGLFSYRYKGQPEKQVGVMAQEVARKQPHAVHPQPSGYLAVDYAEIA